MKAIISTILILLCSASFAQPAHQITNSKYHFDRAPYISPEIISDLSTGLADHGDLIVSINLDDAQGSNRFAKDVKTRKLSKKGYPFVFVEYPPVEKGDNPGEFGYQFIGKTTNGIFVIQTLDATGGGSGEFENLMLLTFEKDTTIDESIHRHKIALKTRTLLKKLSEIGLGDRTDNSIRINGNKITMKSSTPLHSKEKPVTKTIDLSKYLP